MPPSLDTTVPMSPSSSTQKSSLAESESLPPSLFYCPYYTCKHHKIGHGFTKRGSLDSHIQHAHHGLWSQNKNDASTSENDTANDYSSDESDVPICKLRPRGKYASSGQHHRAQTEEVVDVDSIRGTERYDKVLVDKDHLREMERMIKSLQRRISQCERKQDDSSDSDDSSRGNSIDSSIFEHRRKPVREVRPLRHQPSEDIIEIVDDDSRTVSPPEFYPPPPHPPLGPIVPASCHGSEPPDVLPPTFGHPADGSGGPRAQIMRWKQCSECPLISFATYIMCSECCYLFRVEL